MLAGALNRVTAARRSGCGEGSVGVRNMISWAASLPARCVSGGQLEGRWRKLEYQNTPCRHAHKHSHLVHTTVGPPGTGKHADTRALTVQAGTAFVLLLKALFQKRKLTEDN